MLTNRAWREFVLRLQRGLRLEEAFRNVLYDFLGQYLYEIFEEVTPSFL